MSTGAPLLPAEPMLAALDVGPIGISKLFERGDPVVDQDDLERRAVVVIPPHSLGAHANRVLRQAHALGNVLLEHEPEAASLLEPIDLGSRVGTQGRVLYIVNEDVELAADHALSLSAGRHGRVRVRTADLDAGRSSLTPVGLRISLDVHDLTGRRVALGPFPAWGLELRATLDRAHEAAVVAVLVGSHRYLRDAAAEATADVAKNVFRDDRGRSVARPAHRSGRPARQTLRGRPPLSHRGSRQWRDLRDQRRCALYDECLATYDECLATVVEAWRGLRPLVRLVELRELEVRAAMATVRAIRATNSYITVAVVRAFAVEIRTAARRARRR